MTQNPHEILGRAIAAHFQRDGAWPTLRSLQRHFTRLGSVERIAADAPPDLLLCESGHRPGPVCKLTLRGFHTYAPGAPEVDNYLGAARYAATRALEDNDVPRISSAEVAAELTLDPSALARLGVLIMDWGGLWQSATGIDANGEFSFSPSKDAWYFEEVRSVTGLLAAQTRASDDHVYSAERRNAGWVGKVSLVREGPSAYGARGFTVTLDRFSTVRNDSLRNMLICDARELNRAFEQGSWKSVGFLAGSCCEGMLIDVLDREEPRTSDRLGPDWRHKKGLSHLVSVAHSFGILNASTAEFAGYLKKWRDLIHPWKASTHPAPTREVAMSIVALLEWILAEFSSHGNVGHGALKIP